MLSVVFAFAFCCLKKIFSAGLQVLFKGDTIVNVDEENELKIPDRLGNLGRIKGKISRKIKFQEIMKMNRAERRSHLQTAEGIESAKQAATAKQARKQQYESAARAEAERLEQFRLDEAASDAAFVARTKKWQQTPHEHEWIQSGAAAGNAMSGDWWLYKVSYYCEKCRRVKTAMQSASTCKWQETMEDEMDLGGCTVSHYDWAEEK